MTARHRIAIGAIIATGFVTSASPAFAWISDINANGSYVPAGSATMYPKSAPPSSSAAVVKIIPSSGGFDWGDGGIGAAGGLAISLITIGAAVAISDGRRRPQTTFTQLTESHHVR